MIMYTRGQSIIRGDSLRGVRVLRLFQICLSFHNRPGTSDTRRSNVC